MCKVLLSLKISLLGLLFSGQQECGLDRRWSVIGPDSEDFDRLQRHRQPVYRVRD